MNRLSFFTITLSFCAYFGTFSQTSITLQPTGASGKDAMISSRFPNANNGTAQDFAILAWTNQGNPDTYRQLIEFDLSSIPAGATILSATLTLYHDPLSLNTNAIHQSLSGSNAMVLQRVTTPWDEMTVTWSNQPSTSTAGQIMVPQSTSTTQDYVIDLSASIQDAVTNPSTYYGFMLKLQNEAYYRSVILASSDNPDPANHPKLDITYLYNVGVEAIDPSVFHIFPTPVTSGLLTIVSEETARAELYTTAGQLVLSSIPIEAHSNTIDIRSLDAGIYFLKLSTQYGTFEKRLVVQ